VSRRAAVTDVRHVKNTRLAIRVTILLDSMSYILSNVVPNPMEMNDLPIVIRKPHNKLTIINFNIAYFSGYNN
jgi:hypothetical protein